MSDKSYRIVSLQAENFMRLRSIHIQPDGSPVVHIVGENRQGKTSCLRAIASALGGKDLCPEVPVRLGAENAEVTVDLGEFVVTRRWTEDGKSTLTIKSPDGMKYSSPQAMLDKLVGKLSFDPLAFTRAKPVDQVETLRGLVGLDFRILDTQRKTTYDQRTEVNRDVDKLKARLDSMKVVNAPDEPVSVAELLKEQADALSKMRDYEQLQRVAEAATSRRAGAETAVARAKDALAKAQRELEQAEGQLKAAQDLEEEEVGEAALAAKPDLAAVRDKIAKSEETNAAVRAKKERAEVGLKLLAKQKEAADLAAKIEGIDKNKAEALAAAKFPIEALSFDDTGVTLNGLPLAQASAAEQLRVSVAIGAALNSKLRVILVRDGSLFDKHSLKLLEEIAEDLDLQVWLEQVSNGDAAGILIEDGEVVAARAVGKAG